MSAIRFALLCTLAVFCFTQVVLSRPDGSDAEGALKSVEAKLSVAVDDIRKAVGDIFQNISSSIQSEIAKNPGASEIYKNVTDTLQAVAKQMQDAVQSITPKP